MNRFSNEKKKSRHKYKFRRENKSTRKYSPPLETIWTQPEINRSGKYSWERECFGDSLGKIFSRLRSICSSHFALAVGGNVEFCEWNTHLGPCDFNLFQCSFMWINVSNLGWKKTQVKTHVPIFKNQIETHTPIFRTKLKLRINWKDQLW